MTVHRFYIVDSFSAKPFHGNPAGVCVPDSELSELEMQAIASELGVSETAFLSSCSAADRFSIRYFSPKMEIPLCGHATLAAAKVMLSESASERVTFENRDGLELEVHRLGEELMMEFPEYETSPADAPQQLLDALGIKVVTNCQFNQETNILLLEVKSCQELKALTPDFEKLIRSHQSINGVLVTAAIQQSELELEEYDFCSRYFWPWSGTNEDPVTGGTHTFLTGYWNRRLGKKKMRSIQLSRRTGSMGVELVGEPNGNAKVLITGAAHLLLKGELCL